MVKVHELEAEVEHLRAQVAGLQDGLLNLLDYVQSDKFLQEPHVNTLDVVLRLGEIRSAHTDLEFEPWGWTCDVSPQREVKRNGYRNFERSGNWRW